MATSVRGEHSRSIPFVGERRHDIWITLRDDRRSRCERRRETPGILGGFVRFLDMRRTLVFLLLLALAGCFRTEPTMSFVNSNIPHRPMIERRPDQVQLYASGPPKRSYVEVGMLQGQGGEYDSPSQVLELMRKEAGRLGCEALIVIGADDSVEGHSNKYFGSTTTYKGFHAVCIVFDVDSSVATSSKASAP